MFSSQLQALVLFRYLLLLHIIIKHKTPYIRSNTITGVSRGSGRLHICVTRGYVTCHRSKGVCESRGCVGKWVTCSVLTVCVSERMHSFRGTAWASERVRRWGLIYVWTVAKNQKEQPQTHLHWALTYLLIIGKNNLFNNGHLIICTFPSFLIGFCYIVWIALNPLV